VTAGAVIACPACGRDARPAARFCDACGSPITSGPAPAECKQVTVLFADVVRSMDIAAAVGAERLREIMAELVDRARRVVQRYGGTVDKFTGDGIMAVFGAPLAMEDHALRACLAALGIQEETARLATAVNDRDGIELQLRVGLNSGQVIAGEIGSGPLGYTAIGEQVGFAQRMESVAPPGGVMLSESTARLVASAAVLGEPEAVRIKGSQQTVPARRLLAIGGHQPQRRSEPNLVGRTWELNTVTAILDETRGGSGCVVNIVGPVGIGKSRLVREFAAIAQRRGVPVFTSYCESHASDVPFHAISRLLRVGMGIDELDGGAARARVRERFSDADEEDLLLLDDLLGIADPAVEFPDIASDARRRRLTALINAAALVRTEPVVYVIEDVHWIDEVSDSMMAGFLAVIPQTPSLVLITSRPEYRGALTAMSGAQMIALRPLNEAQASTLATGLLGVDPSLADLAAHVSTRAAGNPFFAEEMVRDLAERGVIDGTPGAYTLRGDPADADVPATLHATIGARIDRLSSAAKRTLTAAAVIGSRFDGALLASALDSVDVAPLIEAELVDQVRFGRRAEYAFRHPLIRAVAYETQLKSDRAQLHRQMATRIEARDPASAEENAALIAEHFEAAGDLHAAFDWHMRAGAWLNNRDIPAARNSWQRARQVADRIPENDPDRLSKRIAARAALCMTAFRAGGGGADTGFDELRDLCAAAGDKRSLALGLNGLETVNLLAARRREASRLGDELVALLESIGDPTLIVALSIGAATAKHETGEMADVLRIVQQIIDLAGGDPRKGDLYLASPMTLAVSLRGVARMCLGMPGWKDDARQAREMARAFDPLMMQAAHYYTYVTGIPYGVLLPDDTVVRGTAEVLALAEQSADDFTLFGALAARGITLVHRDGPEREAGFGLLAKMREWGMKEQFSLQILPIADIHIAQEKARIGDLDGAVELLRESLDGMYESGGSIWCALATAALAEALVKRGGDGDLREADAAIERLAAVPTDPGYVLHDITLMRPRALLARARGDEASYREHRDSYRAMAKSLGFEGHMKWADAME
jgi:adenylate cyclase